MTELKIVPFKSLPSEHHESCVEVIRRTLARSEKDVLGAIAIVTVTDDGYVTSEYASNDAIFSLLGGLTNIEHRIMRTSVEPHNEVPPTPDSNL